MYVHGLGSRVNGTYFPFWIHEGTPSLLHPNCHEGKCANKTVSSEFRRYRKLRAQLRTAITLKYLVFSIKGGPQ